MVEKYLAPGDVVIWSFRAQGYRVKVEVLEVPYTHPIDGPGGFYGVILEGEQAGMEYQFGGSWDLTRVPFHHGEYSCVLDHEHALRKEFEQDLRDIINE